MHYTNFLHINVWTLWWAVEWMMAFRGAGMKESRSLCGVMSGLLLPLTDKSCFMAGGRKTRTSPWPLIKSTSLFFRWNAGDEMLCFFGLWRVWWLRPEGCEERSGVYVGGWVMGLNWSNAGDGDVISGKETPTIWQLQKITRSYKLIKSKKCIKSNITKVHSQPYECAVTAMSALHWSVVMWNASNGLIC